MPNPKPYPTDRERQVYEAEREKSQNAQKLKSAFKLLAWQHYQEQMDEAEFNTRWQNHQIHSMEYGEIVLYLIGKGFSIQELLLIDSEREQTTLRLRDAFRVLAWQVYETNPEIREDLNQRYTRFYSRWKQSKIRSMDFSQLSELAAERGFSIEQLLTIRDCYYGIAKPYPSMFLDN